VKVLQVTAVDFTLKKFLIPLIDEMEKQGYIVHTACKAGKIAEELKKEGYVIHHIPFERNLNIISHISNVFKLVKLIKKEKYDCIHTHTPVASIIARVAAKIANVPLTIYTAHGFYFHENMRPLVYKAIFTLERIWGKYLTDYIFFQSIEDYQLALEHKFNKPERLIHISNGVSKDKFNPHKFDRLKIRKELGFAEDDLVIMFLGRLVREKGIVELIEAFHNIKKKGFKNVKLMIVGGSVEGDRDGLDIETIINNLPSDIKSDLYLMGLRDDVPRMLAASDIFTLPSYREGLPRSIIEAMAMGKPIVATNIRGCREEVFPGENGYLCESKNSKDLEEKLLLLINDENKRKVFGNKSRELFLEKFDEQLVLERQLKVFNQYKKEKRYV
jgi:glycosyltransferase involved in cell wall biosynthesis